MCTPRLAPKVTTSTTSTSLHECPAWQVAAYDDTHDDALLDDDMDDPIPFEDRFESIDGERILSRDPEDLVRTRRRQLAGSFHEWMRQTFLEEEAARRIQQCVRHKLLPTRELTRNDKSSTTFNSASTLSFVSQDDEVDEDEDHLQYEVYLWHGSYLGLEFYACNVTGLPCVSELATGNDSLPGMWNLRAGDYLLSINDCSVHQDTMAFDDVVRILEDGVRPAVLRFRHPKIQEMRYRSSAARIQMHLSMTSEKKEQQRRRAQLERSLCYVVWREEDGPLGVVFVKPDANKPYPSVAEVIPTGVVARESARAPVEPGDLLLSINHMDVSTIGYSMSLEIMKFAPRPLVLTFRRSTPKYPVARSLEL